MKLKRFLLRYYPPGEFLQSMNFLLWVLFYCLLTLLPSGILLEYEQSGQIKSKSIDFLDLRPEYVCLLARKQSRWCFASPWCRCPVESRARVSMASLTGYTRKERTAIQQFLPQPNAQCWTNHSTVFNTAAVTLYV